MTTDTRREFPKHWHSEHGDVWICRDTGEELRGVARFVWSDHTRTPWTRNSCIHCATSEPPSLQRLNAERERKAKEPKP